MTGSHMTSMTLEEMRAACARGEDRSDWEQVRREVGAGVEPAPDAESPDASDLLRAEIQMRRRGRPRASTKVFAPDGACAPSGAVRSRRQP